MPAELYKLPPPLRSIRRQRPCSAFRKACIGVFCAFWIMTPVLVVASDQEPSLGLGPSDVLIEETIDRRVELKRTLLISGELPESNKRRALSQDERDVLNRELREAISGLYEQRAEERARNRASR